MAYLLFHLLAVVLTQSYVPGHTDDRRHRAELVYDVPRDEVDVVISQFDAGVTDPVTPHLVQFGLIHPGHTLKTDKAQITTG